MKVSCLCITYNRAPNKLYLLNEAVHSFLQQSWPDKELVIINDCPGQTLIFDHPQVSVINLPIRCRSYGEKMALAVTLSKGDFLTPWDDDDISLPMRIEIAMDTLMRLKAQHYKSHGQWFLNKSGLTNMNSFVGHNNALFTRSMYVKAKGYEPFSLGADAHLDREMRRLEPPAVNEMSKDKWQYIYRWGVSGSHLSASYDPKDTEAGWRKCGEMPVEKGTFHIEPQWLYNYSRLTAQAAASGLTVYPTPDLVFWGD